MTHNQRGAVFATIVISLIVLAAAGAWFWHVHNSAAKAKGANAVEVVSAPVIQTNVAVTDTSNGTVAAVQTVDIRPQNSATIKTVHIKEGQFVRKGDRLFSLDTRTEDANLKKAEAQVVKDHADILNADRNFERQRELLKQQYVSQSEFDAAQDSADSLHGQLAIDLASVDAARVARSYDDITAPITGRTGAIAVYPGSLVQPGTSTAVGAVMVSITQLDPIDVSFTLPEQELASLQQAFAKGKVPVIAKLDTPGQKKLKGRLIFVDNSVDTASGTIRLKAEFPNPGYRLWPGMFVNVELSPRTLNNALTVPAQAVQTGPENKFLYVIGADNIVSSVPVNVILVQGGIAVVEGITPGSRVVVEGAQNLQPGSIVIEAADNKSAKQTGSYPGTANHKRAAGQQSNAGKE